MAIEFTSTGIESLKGRSVTFKNGSPTNMPGWEWFKRLPEKIKELKGETMEIDRHLVESTFNPVIELLTGRTIHSSFIRFKLFCEENNLETIEHGQGLCVYVREKSSFWKSETIKESFPPQINYTESPDENRRPSHFPPISKETIEHFRPLWLNIYKERVDIIGSEKTGSFEDFCLKEFQVDIR